MILEYWIRCRNYLILMVPLLIFSCQRRNSGLNRLVEEWKGKEIDLDGLVYTKYGNDTIKYDTKECDYKIFTYVDSQGCTDCKMKLEEWKSYLKELKSISCKRLGFVYYCAPKSKKTTQYLLQKHEFDLPVCIDTTNRLGFDYNLPRNYTLQTFLLDKKNKVKVIGNPLLNKKIKDLYQEILQE